MVDLCSAVSGLRAAIIRCPLPNFLGRYGGLAVTCNLGVGIVVGIADAAFNSVVCANLSRETADAQIGSVLSHFQRHRRPFTWHIGPSTMPAELDAFLLAHGMVHSEDEPGMAVEIDNMRSNFSAPSGL